MTPDSTPSTTITGAVNGSRGAAVIVCDVSPPRGGRGIGASDPLARAASLDADFLYVSYNPGQSVRVASTTVARRIESQFGKPAIFGMATRDMNRIAIQSLLLGASWDGLRNVVVLRGDPIGERDRGRASAVGDYTTTGLLSDIVRMNRGVDFRGLALDGATSFCPGATADFGRSPDAEIALTAKKAKSGAEFLLCQAQFDAPAFADCRRRLSQALAGAPPPAMFAGAQIPHPRGVDFGNMPDRVRRQLDAGRAGLEIAMDETLALWSVGVRLFYIVPPIARGGIRDYDAADDLVRYVRSLESRRD